LGWEEREVYDSVVGDPACGSSTSLTALSLLKGGKPDLQNFLAQKRSGSSTRKSRNFLPIFVGEVLLECQASVTGEKLETDRLVILSEAKNLHMKQRDSSVVHMDSLRMTG
jgi:hypothetical protein